jgi:hypothetical protein
VTAPFLLGLSFFVLQALPNTQYYRANAPPLNLDAARITSDVSATFPYETPFVPALTAVLTWFAVQRYGNTSSLNTYQAVLAADVAGRSFATLWFVKKWLDVVGTRTDPPFLALCAAMII